MKSICEPTTEVEELWLVYAREQCLVEGVDLSFIDPEYDTYIW